MKIILIVLFNVLLISFTGKGQQINDSRDSQEKLRKLIQPDPLKLKADTSLMGFLNSQRNFIRPYSFNSGTESSMKGLFESDKLKRFDGKSFPTYQPKRLNGDIIVLNPLPSGDKMPNATITSPGVHYFLKVIPKQNEMDTTKQAIPHYGNPNFPSMK